MVSHTPCTLKCDYTLYIYYGAAHHRSPVFFARFSVPLPSVPLFVVLTCLIAVPDCLRVVVSSPSFLPESPSFPSLRFFLPLLPFFFFFFAFFLPFSPFCPCFSLFFILFLKKLLKHFVVIFKLPTFALAFRKGGLISSLTDCEHINRTAGCLPSCWLQPSESIPFI